MERELLSKLARHTGHFEGFNVVGTKLLATDRTESWHLVLWNNEGEDASYWKTGGEFRTVGTHIFDPSANGGTTFDLGPIVEPSAAELASVDAAMREWLSADGEAEA